MKKNIFIAICLDLLVAACVHIDGREEDLDLVIIGKTGGGKSATGNTILGKKSFETSPSFTSVTKTAQFDYAEINNRVVKVVDSPGVFDTDLSQVEGLKLFIEAIHSAIAVNPVGYHAFLLVVRFGSRFTEEDQKTISYMKKIFGDDFFSKFVIVVVTHGDDYDPEETGIVSYYDWVKTQEGPFKRLVDECGGRVILFENKCKDEVKKKSQVDKLLSMVDGLSVLGLRYTNSHFQMALNERDKMMVENKLPMIQEESLREASLILDQIVQVQHHEPKKRLQLLQALKLRAEALLESVLEQDKNTSVLNAIIVNSRHIVQNVENNMEEAREAIEIETKQYEKNRIINELKGLRDQARNDNNFQLASRFDEEIADLEMESTNQIAVYKARYENLKDEYEKVTREYRRVREESAGFWSSLFGGVFEFLYNLVTFRFLRDDL